MSRAKKSVRYSADRGRRWILYSIALLIPMCVVLPVLFSEVGKGPVGALLLVMSPSLAILLIVVSRTGLKISEFGIHYSSPGFNAKAAWNDIELIAVKPTLRGIVLKTSSEQVGLQRGQRFTRMTLMGTAYYSEQQQALMLENRFIDLRAFRTQLGLKSTHDTLRQFAPHLHIG